MSQLPESTTKRRFCVFVSSFLAAALVAGSARADADGPELNGPVMELPPPPEAVRPSIESNPMPLRQVWTISSRQAHAYDPHGPHLQYWRHDHRTRHWTPATHAEFLASDRPGAPTCFFVHGNRVDSHQAFDVGWQAYRQLAAQTRPEQPIRFVIWSWPSTEIEGPLKDVRYKAWVGDSHAWHLAWLLDQMHPDVPISLVGYSYGSRLITGSLHLLGGGWLAGHALAHRTHPQRLPIRVVLMAGAMDSHALAPHGRNARAVSQVERMLVMVNPLDPVLNLYPLLGGIFHKGSAALGFTGFSTGILGPDRSKVAQWNVSGYVGEDHDWRRYLYSPAIASRVRNYALFAE